MFAVDPSGLRGIDKEMAGTIFIVIATGLLVIVIAVDHWSGR